MLKTGRAPSRHFWDARVYPHYDYGHAWQRVRLPPPNLCGSGFEFVWQEGSIFLASSTLVELCLRATHAGHPQQSVPFLSAKKIQTYHAGIQTAGSTLRATTVFVGDHLTTSAIGCGTLLRTQGRWRFEPIARTFRTPEPYSCFKNATSFWRHAYPCTVLLHLVKFPRRQNHLMR